MGVASSRHFGTNLHPKNMTQTYSILERLLHRTDSSVLFSLSSGKAKFTGIVGNIAASNNWNQQAESSLILQCLSSLIENSKFMENSQIVSRIAKVEDGADCSSLQKEGTDEFYQTKSIRSASNSINLMLGRSLSGRKLAVLDPQCIEQSMISPLSGRMRLLL